MDEKFREQKMRGTPLNPIQLYRTADRGKPLFVPFHWHPEIEVIFVLQGDLSLSVGGKSYGGGPGDVFWINPEELHGMSTGSRPASYGALVFPMEFLNFERFDYTQSLYLNPLCRKEKYFSTQIPRQSRHYPQIWEELMQIDALIPERAPYCSIAVKASLFKLVSLLIQDGLLHSAAGPEKRTRASETKLILLKSILSYLNRHFSERLSLSDVSGAFNFSAKYFSRFFKENFNRGLVEYLNDIRIEKAAAMLADPALSIGEIASAVGFDSFSYFIRRFERVFGCTPSRYRKQARESAGGETP